MDVPLYIEWVIPALYLSLCVVRMESWWLSKSVPIIALFLVVPGFQKQGVPVGLMLLLVNFLGGAILLYSETYLRREAGRERYRRFLMLTLSAVNIVVFSANLLILSLAWFMTSVGLHGLLTFYADRPQAIIAAHKKFLLSRLADLCLAVALILIHAKCGSLSIQTIEICSTATSLRLGMFLISLAVILRSALLPVHGWLIQVMEAPTRFRLCFMPEL